MLGRTTFLIAILILSSPMASSARDLWAKRSENLRETDETIDWSSPNKVARIHADINKGQLTACGKVNDIRNMMNPGLTEVNWSTQANAFFINSSDGGDVGTWSTRVFLIRENGDHEVKVSEAISRQDFPSVTPREYLNVMSIGWINHGSALLVLRQVPNSSRYRDMNVARVYVVDVQTESVTEELTSVEADKKYHAVFGPGAKAVVSQSSDDAAAP